MSELFITLDQLQRPFPGGIGTYATGLLQGLKELAVDDFNVTGVVAKGNVPYDVHTVNIALSSSPFGLRATTALWPYRALGVTKQATIVHATSMAGPYRGGTSSAIHSVLIHDLAWREAPELTTRRGRSFHERRLKIMKNVKGLRVFVYSPSMRDTLEGVGFSREQLHLVRLGVDDVDGCDETETARDLLRQRGIDGSFSLFVGTREPRKNLERLISAHREAQQSGYDVGPLVLVGPSGWGEVSTNDATLIPPVERPVLRALISSASLLAYVPISEGWGLPPVEALRLGTRVVVSASVPSVDGNIHVVKVDPKSTSSITQGLIAAISQGDTSDDKSARSASVATLTWRNCALDHLAGWQ
jgi:glycosyltransferase involved in cell wall biosynthesis